MCVEKCKCNCVLDARITHSTRAEGYCYILHVSWAYLELEDDNYRLSACWRSLEEEANVSPKGKCDVLLSEIFSTIEIQEILENFFLSQVNPYLNDLICRR